MVREHKGERLGTFPDNYTVIDIRTTGPDSSWDDLILVSGLRIVRGGISREKTELVKPAKKRYNNNYISTQTISRTGITNDMLEEAEPIGIVLPEFKKFIGEDILIGHNVNFAIDFLYDKFAKYKLGWLDNDFVDTLQISWLLSRDESGHRLEELIYRYGIKTDYFRRTDVRVIWAIYEKMKKELGHDDGYKQLTLLD